MSVYMKTYTNHKLNPLEPNVEDIRIEDIAHALSYICRGNGQVTHFYSVGQHCINAAKEAKARGESERIQLACLLHDASEAYMSDVIRPIKQFLPKYMEIEDNFLRVVFEKYGIYDIIDTDWTTVKKIDNDLMAYDMAMLLGEEVPEEGFGCARTPDIDFKPFEEVEKEYLEIFTTLVRANK